MSDALVHPERLARLDRFFPTLCNIERAAIVQDEHGEETLTWSVLVSDARCSIHPQGGTEMREEQQTTVRSTHHIDLQGYYPALVELDRVVAEGRTYNVLLVEHDSQRSRTSLAAEIVT